MRRLGVTFGAYAPIVPADRAVGYLDGEDGYPSSAGRVHLAFLLVLACWRRGLPLCRPEKRAAGDSTEPLLP